MNAHIFSLKQAAFVLWRPANTATAPQARHRASSPPATRRHSPTGENSHSRRSRGDPDLWSVAAASAAA